jgi:hypothetical protein
MKINRKSKSKKNSKNYKNCKKNKTKVKNKIIRRKSIKNKRGGQLPDNINNNINKEKEEKEEKAKKTIQQFMINKKTKIKALFLKSICTDSGVCIAFGKEANNIKKFFDYFKNYHYVQLPIRKIGESSSNGFIKEIKYTKEGYNAYSILKSTAEQKGDNLYYEYLVGQFINKKSIIFPCFIETYNIYKYNSEQDWTQVRYQNDIMDNIFKNKLTLLPNMNLLQSCIDAQYLAITIQHIDNAKTLYQKIINQYDQVFTYDLIYILYQIYMPLATISDTFTHYDLHANNVLIYEPYKNKYIEYFYHPIDIQNMETTSFKCRYIAKIIDYGRAYFKDGDVSSLDIYNDICKIKECGGSACGYDYGYKRLLPERYSGSMGYISAQKSNISHDLRILYSLKYSNYSMYPELRTMLNHVRYETNYGTKEVKDEEDNVINNVKDALNGLDYIIHMEQYKKINEMMYSKLQKMGELHIFEDGRPMEYIPMEYIPNQ